MTAIGEKLQGEMAKARSMGMARNRTRFKLIGVAHHIEQGLSIKQASCV